MLPDMASVLWLDFDSVVLETPLTPQFLARFRHTESASSAEETLIATVDSSDISDEDLGAFAQDHSRIAKGVMELWDWAHWNGWHVAFGGVTFDTLMDPLLDAAGLDRVARHCGRTDTLYKRRLRFLSPRGVEIRSRFVAAYLGSYLTAGDFIIYVGGAAADLADATLAHACILPDKGASSRVESPALTRTWDTVPDVTAHLEKEAEAWRASFSSTTAAEG